MNTNHRYLDVMTIRTSNGGLSNETKTPHSKLLIEPVLLPSLEHIQIANERNLAEPCLFYPNGEKNKNLRREIENTVVKHHLIERSQAVKKREKELFRLKKVDKYAHVKQKPLYYAKKPDPETDDLILKMKGTESRIHGTVQIRL